MFISKCKFDVNNLIFIKTKFIYTKNCSNININFASNH